jgi:hypothetical protein
MDLKLTIFAILNRTLNSPAVVGNQAEDEAQLANGGQRQNKTGKAP